MSDSGQHINDAEVVQRLLRTRGTWAVVGLSNNTGRAAHDVAAFLVEALSHDVVPVHPRAEEVFGRTGYPSLADIPDGTTVDVVDCFVNSRRVGEVVDQAIEHKDRLGTGAVWLQLGVVDEDAARRAKDAGLEVVMDTCPKIEYVPTGL